MDQVIINVIADSYANLIKAYPGVSRDEAIQVACRILYVLATGQHVGTSQVAGYTTKPQPADTTKQASMGEGVVLAHKGEIKSCTSCKRDIYRLIYDVRGVGMGRKALMAAYQPTADDIPSINDEAWERVLRDSEGGIFIDCPVCKAKSSLQIVGVASVQDKPTVIDGVGSIGGGEF